MFEPFEYIGTSNTSNKLNLNDITSVLHHVPNADKIEYINHMGLVKYYHDVNS